MTDVPEGAPEAKPYSESNPAIPKALLTKAQRKGDTTHKPFRPSPLSGKSPPRTNSAEETKPGTGQSSGSGRSDDDRGSVPTSPSQAEGYTTPPAADTVRNAKDQSTTYFKLSGDESEDERRSNQTKPTVMALSSEESEEEKKQSRSEGDDGPDDEITLLNKRLDARMNELAGVDKKLADIEGKATRLFEVISGQLTSNFAQQLDEIQTMRANVLSALENMEGLLRRTTKARDEAVDYQTRDMVERHVTEVELILQHIESLAKELESRQPGMCARAFKNLLWWLRTAFFSLIVCAVVAYILLDEADISRLFAWTLSGAWVLIEFLLKQKGAIQATSRPDGAADTNRNSTSSGL